MNVSYSTESEFADTIGGFDRLFRAIYWLKESWGESEKSWMGGIEQLITLS